MNHNINEDFASDDPRITQMQEDIKQLRTDMRAFTDAWQQARGVVTFIKWITGIAGGLATAFLFMKDHWK